MMRRDTTGRMDARVKPGHDGGGAKLSLFVIAGLVPAIQWAVRICCNAEAFFSVGHCRQGRMDARVKPGHDGGGVKMKLVER